jgi:transposase
MPAGDEGALTLSIRMRVSPEPAGIELLKRYNVALNYAINKILSLNLKTIRDVHNALYRELREWFGLPSRIAVDCYRDALANARAWRRNPYRGRRPRVKKLSMLLHLGSGYRIEDGYVEIIGGIKLRIIGWDRRYDQYENGEARLVYRGDKMMLWISKKIPRPEPYQPRDAIAVDINERKIVYGDDRINKERDTKIDEAHRWKLLAESLQKKYSSPRYPAWRRRKAILNRIRSYHRKTRNILEDWARKTSLEIVRFAKRLGYAVAREDLTELINSLRKIENKDHRAKLIIMGYRKRGK